MPLCVLLVLGGVIVRAERLPTMHGGRGGLMKLPDIGRLREHGQLADDAPRLTHAHIHSHKKKKNGAEEGCEGKTQSQPANSAGCGNFFLLF